MPQGLQHNAVDACCTKAEIVQRAAREFARPEVSNHRYIMVLHTHYANVHVHLSVRAHGRYGQRHNPRNDDLRLRRETFAERLRGWAIQAESSSQVTRRTQLRNERAWQRKIATPRKERVARTEARVQKLLAMPRARA